MSRYSRALSCALLTAALAVTASPAIGKPPAKPTVTTPLLSVSKPGATYDVLATWTASANTTSFTVKLTNAAGTTLDSGKVSTTSWTGHTTAPAGTAVRVTVTPVAGIRKGLPKTSNPLILPDLTAPIGTFSVVRNNGTGGVVAIHKDSLIDDVSLPNDITATVEWDEGSGTVNWPAPFADLGHVYSETPAVHYAQVTVTDQAGKSRTYPLTIVVNDTAPPTGSFTVSTASAWASWTKVSLTQVTVNDNLSAGDTVARVVDWKDGSAPQLWSQGSSATHVFTKAGTFKPVLTLTDEGGNAAEVPVPSAVVVTVDTVKPVIKLTPPKTRKAYVASWRTLTGRASDAQTGVRSVALRAIEKRGTSWYAYKAGTRTWVQAATKAGAWHKATAAGVKPAASGTWSIRVAKLTKGTLIYRARAFDNTANASAWVTKQAVLTKR